MFFTEIKRGPAHKTSQDKSPVHFNHHGLFVEEELSDDEYSNNPGNSGFFHGSTKNTDSVGCKTKAVFESATTLDVDGDNEDHGDLQNCWKLHETKINHDTLPQCEEDITRPVCTDQEADVTSLSSNLLSFSLNSTNPDYGLVGLKCSSELHHREVVQFNTMMSNKGSNMPQQQNFSIDGPSLCLTTIQPSSSSTQCETPLQDCTIGDASELGGASTVNTVTLWRKADESFGIDVEIISYPVKVIITRLKPGGAAGRVCLIALTSITTQYQ